MPSDQADRSEPPRDERIFVLAPAADAEVIAAASAEGGFSVQRVDDMASLCAAIGEGAGAVVLVDRFRRQHPIAGFIADFYCPSLRLAVEVDGGVHAAQAGQDAHRNEAFRRLGISVLSVSNSDVLDVPSEAFSLLLSTISQLAQRHPPPKPAGHSSQFSL
jgi:hypothetical protein